MAIYTLNPDGTLRPADQPRPRTHAQRLRSTTAWQAASAATIARQPWCSICGATTDLTADHITPLSAGGHPYHPANLRTLCRRHNSSKGARRGNG